MTAETRDIALLAMLIIAPVAIVMIIALVRGYRIELWMSRNGHRRKRRGDDEDEGDE